MYLRDPRADPGACDKKTSNNYTFGTSTYTCNVYLQCNRLLINHSIYIRIWTFGVMRFTQLRGHEMVMFGLCTDSQYSL